MGTTNYRRLLSLAILACCCNAGFPLASSAQESKESSDSSPVLEEIVERLKRLEQDFEALKKNRTRAVPEDVEHQRVVPMLETPYLGRYYAGRGDNRYSRYFLVKLSLVNLTPEPVQIEREDIELVSDENTLKVSNVPNNNNLRYSSIYIGSEQIQPRNIQPEKILKIAPGRMRSTWLFFDGIEDGTHVPELKLKIAIGEKPLELDVNALQKDVLAMEIERIGPRGSLGLLTVNGQLNTINIGSLMDELDQLASQKVVRMVMRWSEGSPPPDRALTNWIVQNAQSSQRHALGESQFPVIPATIREFHLCKVPENSTSTRRGRSQQPSTTPGVHKTEAAAVEAALSSAFQTLPRDELLASIEEGHLLSRVAALSTGGGRLAEDKLPVILRYADDNDPLLQQASLEALRHFGDEAAVATLVRFVKKNNEPMASTAIASLAGSRFAAAHEALLQIMENEPPGSLKKIVKVLAEHPRPIWSDAIFRFVNDPREGLSQEALLALTQVGHPRLIEVLNDALNSKNDKLRKQAFQILASRTDPKSETIAVEYGLKQLEQESLDSGTFEIILKLLDRVKDNRAVPLLLTRFSKQSNKHSIIRTLALLGDETVAEFFVEKFPELQSQEKAEVLTALRTLHSPKFQELATSSLLSDNHSLVRAAAQGLYQDGSPAAINVLITALQKGGNATSWHEICNVLGQLSTPEVRRALLQARDSGSDQKRQYASEALRSIYRRSPAIQQIGQAQQLEQQKKYEEALKLYDVAVQLDPLLPDAFSGRANLYLKQEKYAEAGPDFQKVLELDPWNSQALTGLCIVMVMHEGKSAEAIEKLEKERPKFKKEYLFPYNAACVYARVVEHMKSGDKAEEHKEKIDEYTQQALTDLEVSVKRGFKQLDWMREDPDLKTLHGLPKFQEISQMKTEGS